MEDKKNLFVRTMRGERVERLPVIPYVSQFAAVRRGVAYREFCTRAETLAECIADCQRAYDFDGVHVSTDSAVEAETMGCEVFFPEDDVPTVSSHPLAQGRDLGLLRVPDPKKDGRLPMYLEAIRRLDDDYGGRMVVISGCDGPLTIAGHLLGIERVMTDMVDDPPFVRELLDRASEATIAFSGAQIEAGTTVAHVGDPEAALLGPRLYREFCHPCYVRIARRLREIAARAAAKDVFLLYHFCGDARAILPDVASTGVDLLDVDSLVPMGWAKGPAGAALLKGNINPTAFLEGQGGGMADLVQGVVGEMGQKNFVIGTGCHIPANTHPDNLKRFMDAGRRYGAAERRMEGRG